VDPPEEGKIARRRRKMKCEEGGAEKALTQSARRKNTEGTERGEEQRGGAEGRSRGEERGWRVKSIEEITA
jgi:hypothetical protein